MHNHCYISCKNPEADYMSPEDIKEYKALLQGQIIGMFQVLGHTSVLECLIDAEKSFYDGISSTDEAYFGKSRSR